MCLERIVKLGLTMVLQTYNPEIAYDCKKLNLQSFIL